MTRAPQSAPETLMDKDRPSVLLPSIDPALELSDSDLFWQAHWKKFVAALVALVVLILAVGAWSLWHSHVRSSAESLYSTATNVEGWREVMAKFPGTVSAGNAQLELAAALRAEGKPQDAATELEQLVATQPEHPLAGAAWLTLGELRQMQNNQAGALEAYRTASSRYKSSYAAPLALLAEANLLKASGSAGEARAVFQSIGSLYPATPAAMVAEAEAGRLGVSPTEAPAAGN
jgi:tetratricopeptide (TPR) repeat protein